MKKRKMIAKYISFFLLTALCLSAIVVTTPADQLAPGRPQMEDQTTAEQTLPIVQPARPVYTGDPAPEKEAPVAEASADDDEEEFVEEAEPEIDPNVEPDEEIAFIDGMIADAKLDDALAAIDGRMNILLVGLDARPKQKTGRSDTMIVVSLDKEKNNIKMISLMRDLYVEIPGRKNNRINSAYVYGGPELLMKTIEHNFGIKIDHYVAVNFSALASIIDQVGGLTVDVNSKYVKRINAVIKEDNKVLGISTNNGLLKEGGEQLLTGKQAQAYARYRYGTNDGDFGRTIRQREIVMKLLSKVKSLPMTQLVKLAMGNMEQVSTDMSITEMIQLAPAAFQLSDGDMQELRIPVDKGYESKMVSGMAVLVPDRKKTRTAIANFLTESN